jgi:hypothetical protein
MEDFSRKQAKKFKPKINAAVRHYDYDAFRAILIELGVEPGSDRFRSLEADFWRAVAAKKRERASRS